jgi:capsular exopolysaccharide synthesis family protein
MAENFSEPLWEKDGASRRIGQVINPKEFIFKYLKYLPWVLVCVAIGLALAWIKIRYTVPVYHVQSSMLVGDQDDQVAKQDPKYEELFVGQEGGNINNEVQILRSSPVIERVVRALNLQTLYYNKGKLRSSLVYPQTPIKLQILHLGDSTAGLEMLVNVIKEDSFTLNIDPVSHPFGQAFNYNGSLVALVRDKSVSLRTYNIRQFLVDYAPARSVAFGIMGGLLITPPGEQSTILTLAFDGENTALGIDVLNTLMSVYDTLRIEDKNRISTNTLKFIDAQLDILKQQLGNYEGKSRGFIIENNAFDLESQSKSYIENLGDISKEEAKQRVKIAVLDLVLNYVTDPKNADKLVPTDLGIEEPTVAQYFLEYNRMQLQRETSLKTTKPDNPMIRDIDGTLEKMRVNMAQALRNVKQGYEIAVRNLEQQASENQSLLRETPGKTMSLVNIQRQQKILEDLYSFLLMKRLETAISSAATVSNSKVVEPAAAASEPISPNQKSIYIIHLVIALLIPIGISTLIEILKDKVANRLDVEKATRAPILGEIGHSDFDETLVVAKNSRRFVAEQFRVIRTNLQFIVGKKDRPIIMVTSSFSGEGKSFISTNVGAVMALTGKKTVIMEFDIRKPKIVAGLDLKRKMGISNYIIGKASFEELVLPVEDVENLYVIPCGPVPPNPSELLLDPRMDELMEEVRARFEVVIMDTAPVGLVSDALNLGKYADCTLYIVRQGHTFRRQLQLIEDFYTQKKLPKISIILNDVKAEGSYYGSYGYYGGYGYYGNYKSGSTYFEDESRRKRKGHPFSNLFKRREK